MIAIIADDLSGACDTAVKMCINNNTVRVLMDAASANSADADVIAVSTDSRSLSRELAYAQTKKVVTSLCEAGVTRLYKKIDSVFRGNVAAEISASMDALGSDLALIASAFPACGRRIIHGELYVDDATQSSIDVYRFLSEEFDLPCALIPLTDVCAGAERIYQSILCAQEKGARIILFDTDTEEELRSIAAACQRLSCKTLPVGSAGLMAAFAKLWREDEYRLPASFARLAANIRHTLVVVGTRHRTSQKQVQTLLNEPDVACVQVNVADCVHNNGARQIRQCVQDVGDCMQANPAITMLVVDSLFQNQGVETTGPNGEISIREIVECLSQIVRQLVETFSFDTLFVTGGDTANAVLRALGVTSIRLVGECAPGIPVGYVHTDANRDLILAVKSGGFGSESVFEEFVDYISNTVTTINAVTAMKEQVK